MSCDPFISQNQCNSLQISILKNEVEHSKAENSSTILYWRSQDCFGETFVSMCVGYISAMKKVFLRTPRRSSVRLATLSFHCNRHRFSPGGGTKISQAITKKKKQTNTDLGIISRHLVVKVICAVEARPVDDVDVMRIHIKLFLPQHPGQESCRQHRTTVDYSPQRRHLLHHQEARTAESLINLPPSKCSLLDSLVASWITRSSFYSFQLCIVS